MTRFHIFNEINTHYVCRNLGGAASPSPFSSPRSIHLSLSLCFCSLCRRVCLLPIMSSTVMGDWVDKNPALFCLNLTCESPGRFTKPYRYERQAWRWKRTHAPLEKWPGYCRTHLAHGIHVRRHTTGSSFQTCRQQCRWCIHRPVFQRLCFGVVRDTPCKRRNQHVAWSIAVIDSSATLWTC